MKAWFVTLRGYEEDSVGDIVFAETRGKARVKGLGALDLDRSDFPELRVLREPRFDGEPRALTSLEWLEAGYGIGCDGPDCWRRVYELSEEEGYADEWGRVCCRECQRTKNPPLPHGGAALAG